MGGSLSRVDGATEEVAQHGIASWTRREGGDDEWWGA
jgi:hypothetical protein